MTILKHVLAYNDDCVGLHAVVLDMNTNLNCLSLPQRNPTGLTVSNDCSLCDLPLQYPVCTCVLFIEEMRTSNTGLLRSMQ